jgi:hypothetical protein
MSARTKQISRSAPPFDDARKANISATLMKTANGDMLVRPTITFLVHDTVDFCPGDCGLDVEQVPLSRFEATGLCGDVPFTVLFAAPLPEAAPFTVPMPAVPAPVPPESVAETPSPDPNAGPAPGPTPPPGPSLQVPPGPVPETPSLDPNAGPAPGPTPTLPPSPGPESPPEPSVAPDRPLNVGYTQCDFLDDNISTEAQRALYSLYKRDGDSRNDALRMLGAVKSGQMQGVYKEDEQRPALIAARHGGSWWTAVPPGQGAVVSAVEPPPFAVFRNAVASDREQLADALDAAWQGSPLAQETIAIPPPSGKECPLIPPPPHDEPTPDVTPPDALPLCIDQIDWDSYFTPRQDQCFAAVAAIAAVCAASNASATPPNIGKDIEERLLAIATAALGLVPTGCAGYVWTVDPLNPTEPGVQEKVRQLTTQRVEDCVVGVSCAGMKETERAELARDPRRCDPWISPSRSECEEIRQRYRKWLAKH